MTTADLLARRRKLAALAERGVDGERDNAKRMLAAFDAKHPGPGQSAPNYARGTYTQPTATGGIRVVVNGVERFLSHEDLAIMIARAFAKSGWSYKS